MNTNTKITFNDVIGYTEAKKEFREIEKFILEPSKYESLGVRAPKGIILVGAPGNGKTMMVKALANEINIPILSYGDETDDPENHVKNLRDIFEKARTMAPCIIFIDELDKLDENSNERDLRVERELVTLLDGYHENEGVIVIATANSINRLDDALLRSGRFDRVIRIDDPNQEERALIFEHYLKSKELDDTIDYKNLAKRTKGLSCADIDNIINDGMLIAIRDNRNKISIQDIEKSIDRVVFKTANKKEMIECDKRAIAIHEVGHALIAIKTGTNRLINKITIESRGEHHGFIKYTSNLEEGDSVIINKNDLLNKIRTALGGYAAEKIYLKESSTGAANDLIEAGNTLRNMLSVYGMFGLKYQYFHMNTARDPEPTKGFRKKYEKVYVRELNKAYKDCNKILKENKDLFKALYDALLEKEVLLKEDIFEIVEKFK